MARNFRPAYRRAVLYVPGANSRALAKAPNLGADAIIVDLEDAVSPVQKDDARRNMADFVSSQAGGATEIVVRVNALGSQWGVEDLRTACSAGADAILLPKVNGPEDLVSLRAGIVPMGGEQAIWAMIETAEGLLNLREIAAMGRDGAVGLSCLVGGTNDIIKETGVAATPDRASIAAWLSQIVLAGRAYGLDILDGVYGDFRHSEGFAAECAAGRALGFTGKTLIHPSQIDGARRAFSPSRAEVEEAELIVAAFAEPQNADKGVISENGRMLELLHLEQSQRLLDRYRNDPHRQRARC